MFQNAFQAEKIHWEGNSRDFKVYREGCIPFQQKEMERADSEWPYRLGTSWQTMGLLLTKLITGLAMTDREFDAISPWIDRLSLRAHSVPIHSTDNATEVAHSLVLTIFCTVVYVMQSFQIKIRNLYIRLAWAVYALWRTDENVDTFKSLIILHFLIDEQDARGLSPMFLWPWQIQLGPIFSGGELA